MMSKILIESHHILDIVLDDLGEDILLQEFEHDGRFHLALGTIVQEFLRMRLVLYFITVLPAPVGALKTSVWRIPE